MIMMQGISGGARRVKLACGAAELLLACAPGKRSASPDMGTSVSAVGVPQQCSSGMMGAFVARAALC